MFLYLDALCFKLRYVYKHAIIYAIYIFLDIIRMSNMMLIAYLICSLGLH